MKLPPRMNDWCATLVRGKKPTPEPETGGAEKAEPHFHPNIISLTASFVEGEDASHGGAVLGQLG